MIELEYCLSYCILLNLNEHHCTAICHSSLWVLSLIKIVIIVLSNIISCRILKLNSLTQVMSLSAVTDTLSGCGESN